MNKWNIYERPENERKYLASEMANALDVTIPTFYALMRKLDLDAAIIKNEHGRKVLIFSHEALVRCREELAKRENQKNEKKKTDRDAEQAEHPLVTDPRFLRVTYFPNVIPACFEEAD